jgi:PAS domain S-box-containing protein
MNPRPLPSDGRAAEEQTRIYADQVKQLFDNAPLGMVATLINAAALVFVLRETVPQNALILWLACLYLITLIRFVQVNRYRRGPVSPANARRWGAWFIAGTAFTGAAWGSAGIFLFPEASPAHQVFLAFVLGGMVAGAVGTSSVIITAFPAFSIPALTPLIIRFFISGDEIHVAMGGMTLLFAVLFHVVALRIHAVSVLSLTLRHKNSSLVSFLAAAKERAEQLNEELRSEINERKKAEEDLHGRRDRLEELVKERTAALSLANTRLQEEISGRSAAEDLRRQSEAYFRSLIENTLDLITVLDSSGNILFESPSIEKMLGYRRDELIGMNVFEWVHPDDLRVAQAAFTRIILTPGTSESVELRVRHRNGSYRLFESIGKSIVDDSMAVRIMVTSRDIAHRKRMEEDILKVEKLNSLGVLAGGIAHDFNNLMTGITANIGLAKRRVKQDRELSAILENAEQAAVRAHDLTKQLLTFSRGGEPVKKTISISELVKEAAGFALRGSKTGCTFSVPADLKPVEADAGQLRQVIQNIVINADQAMPRGGMIRIACENAAVQAREVQPLAAGEYVKISIADEGVGIPQEQIGKIFDPYFTTREKGSGLGLAAVYSIIKKHGGAITASSEPGVGTTVSVYLPVSLKEAGSPVRTSGELVFGKGRVLIMDDEEIIRDAAGRVLQAAGYEVESAADGNAAIELYCKAREAGKPFDLVIMDLTVPGGVGGKDAVRRLHEIDPGVKAIVSSGYSQDPILANYRDYGFLGVITKPYHIREMSEIVSRVIAKDR